MAIVEELQQRILAGDADHVTPQELLRVARLPQLEQAAAFDSACAAAKDNPPLRANQKLAELCRVPALRVRAVAIFSPARFIEQRRAAERAARAIEQLVSTVNDGLKSPRSRMNANKAVGKVEHALRKNSMTDVYDVVVEKLEHDGRTVSQVAIQRHEDIWMRRRQTDGLTLIVAHPDVLGSAEAIVTLYFAKDKVEKDFQTIKSVLDLRPVNHQTDPKVRAHVSICMLALLLQQTLEQRVRQAGLTLTGAGVLDTLESARLNLFAGRIDVYSVTEPDPDQQRILTALNLEDLADDQRLNATIHPR